MYTRLAPRIGGFTAPAALSLLFVGLASGIAWAQSDPQPIAEVEAIEVVPLAVEPVAEAEPVVEVEKVETIPVVEVSAPEEPEAPVVSNAQPAPQPAKPVVEVSPAAKPVRKDPPVVDVEPAATPVEPVVEVERAAKPVEMAEAPDEPEPVEVEIEAEETAEADVAEVQPAEPESSQDPKATSRPKLAAGIRRLLGKREMSVAVETADEPEASSTSGRRTLAAAEVEQVETAAQSEVTIVDPEPIVLEVEPVAAPPRTPKRSWPFAPTANAKPVAEVEQSSVVSFVSAPDSGESATAGEAAATQVATWNPNEIPTQTYPNDGYFPTQDEKFYLDGYSKKKGQYQQIQTSSGLFPYGYHAYEDHPPVYDEYARVFRPLDRTLGFFGPADAMVLEGYPYQNFSVTADAGMPIFTRTFDPDLAHVKAGPFYADLLSVGATMLYSDYNGPRVFAPDEEDGFLYGVEAQMRALLRVSETFYLSASASFFYLPQENKLGVRAGDGTGINTFARINYEDTLGEWDYFIYDEIRVDPGVEFYDGVGSEAFKKAGRYSFGILNDQTNEIVSQNGVFLTNKAGISASRPINDWRLFWDASHANFWNLDDGDKDGQRDSFGALLATDSPVVPFSPSFFYRLDTTDSFDTTRQRTGINLEGRLTQNIRFDGDVGYFWTTDHDPDYQRAIWTAAVIQELSESTRHSLRVGESYLANDFTSDAAFAEYVVYTLQHHATDRLSFLGRLQVADQEGFGSTFTGHSESVTGSVQYRPGNYVLTGVSATHERRQNYTFDVEERWIVGALISCQVSFRTQLDFRYQFEETETYDEHLYKVTLRRTL